jgi:oxygen-independent coproporphyrinogen-3 oxidase
MMPVPGLLPPPLSLYVHFPWCVRKCPYCDFNSYTLHGRLQEDAYIEALRHDIENQAPAVADREVISVFLGGGTPSLFAPAAIGRVLDLIRCDLKLAPDVEITLEANPGTIERGRFGEYRAAGVNRVSLGAQSFDARRLTVLGRIHSPEDTRRAAEELHAAGLDNFNLDLMYALPGQDVAEAVADVEAAIALKPTHLSHYQLTLEPGTVFAGQPPPGIPGEDIAAAMLDACTERLAAAGFRHYEVSGYALPGRQCRHNLNYWTYGDYLGAGAGAHGKLTRPEAGSIVRTVHSRDPRRYMTGAPGSLTLKEVPERDRPFEFMMNALRLVDGFDRAIFTPRTGLPWASVAPSVEALEDRGLVVAHGGFLAPTATGLRFLNDVLLSFLPESADLDGAFALSTAI